MTGQIDDRIGRFFRDVRAYAGLPVDELARRLATSPHVIASFEAGAVHALPPWPETRRLIQAYGDLAQFDPRTLVDHVHAQMMAPPTVLASHPRPAPAAMPRPPLSPPAAVRTTAVAAPAPATGKARATDRSARVVRHARRAGYVAAVCGVFMVATLWSAHSRPAFLTAAVDLLPQPMAQRFWAGMDLVLLSTAPKREGLKWIEVADPRTRKADKLQVMAR